VDRCEFRGKAKVPIINLTHRCHVEVDISMGLTAQDTTDVVQRMLSLGEYRGKNVFKQVVSFLKVLLAMNDLDAPFTGGIGSFKLYVMVASTYYRRRMHYPPGTMTAGNLLVLFFQDYSEQRYFSKHLNLDVPLSSLSVDLGGVHRIHQCRALFRRCYDILKSRSDELTVSYDSSLLGLLVDIRELKEVRNTVRQNASIALVKESATTNSVSQSPWHELEALPTEITVMNTQTSENPLFEFLRGDFMKRVSEHVLGLVHLPSQEEIRILRPVLHDHLVLLVSAAPQLSNHLLFQGTCNDPAQLDRFGVSSKPTEQPIQTSNAATAKPQSIGKRKRDEEMDAPWRDPGVVGFGIRVKDQPKKKKKKRGIQAANVHNQNNKKKQKSSHYKDSDKPHKRLKIKRLK
jgi:hypothetical protein